MPRVASRMERAGAKKPVGSKDGGPAVAHVSNDGETARGTAARDVKHALRSAALDVSNGRRARIQGRLGKDRSPGESRHSIASTK